MKILITGATGLVGKKLSLSLLNSGHELVILTRSKKNLSLRFPFPCASFEWNTSERPPVEAFAGVDAVVHLAGETVAGRWNAKKKKAIYDSRVDGTRNLVSVISELKNPPSKFVCASAIGIYGDRGDEELTEKVATKNSDYLAEVCKDWEDFSLPDNIAVSKLRIGLVLSREGGFLDNLEDLFRTGFAGNLGSGKQWMSWVHIEDVIGLINHCLNQDISGVFNATAPHPVRNSEFTRSYAKTLNRPAFLPAPQFGLHLAVGEFAKSIFASQKVIPESALNSGYSFQFSDLEAALADLYSPNDRLFQSYQWLPQSIESVFEFFSNEKNLEKITPEMLNFRVLGMSTEQIEKGTLINYKLKIHGIPASWETLIEEWEPNKRFIDTQTKGPYSLWHHTHEFKELAGGTLMTDKVYYRLPFGYLGDLFGHQLVKRDVKNIFKFRTEKIAELFL